MLAHLKILLVWADGTNFEIRGQYREQLCMVGGASADCRGPGGALEGPGLDMANLSFDTFSPRAR